MLAVAILWTLQFIGTQLDYRIHGLEPKAYDRFERLCQGKI